jgi:hypothetical protein
MNRSSALSSERHVYRAFLGLSVAAGLLGWYRPLATLTGGLQSVGAFFGGLILVSSLYYFARAAHSLVKSSPLVMLSSLPQRVFRRLTTSVTYVQQNFGRKTSEAVVVQYIRRCEECSVRNQKGVYRTTRDETLIGGTPVKLHAVETKCLCKYCDNWHTNHDDATETTPVRSA